MAGDARKLKAILLSEADTEQQREFAKLLAEQCAEAGRKATGHVCWFFIPSPKVYAAMEKYTQSPNYDKCPKCGKGRIVAEVRSDNIGQWFVLKCHWGNDGCGFEQSLLEFEDDD